MKMGRQTACEINIRRLLTRCETMASDAQHQNSQIDWRLPKYLNHLSEEIEALQHNKTASVPEDSIQEYKRKVDFLKDIVKADEIKNPLERVLLCQHLLPSAVINTNPNEHNDFSPTKDLHLQFKGKHQQDLRNELFGDDSNELRNRKATGENSTKDNIDDIIKQHHNMQEKAAEEMIQMAKSMKENSLIASDIIKKDNQELDSTTKVVDSNFKKLKTEQERIEEINRKKCSFTIWIMLAIVCVVFINMIIFIKLFPKRKKL